MLLMPEPVLVLSSVEKVRGETNLVFIISSDVQCAHCRLPSMDLGCLATRHSFIYLVAILGELGEAEAVGWLKFQENPTLRNYADG